MSRETRRHALLDAAVDLLTAGSGEAVSMEAVAELAGVSRPLVYKHFSNRDELLAAVYQREATMLHDELAADVAAAGTLQGMYRALIHGSLRAAAERGHVFAALRAAGGVNRQLREEQRARDAQTVRAFARRAERELGIERRRATTATAMLLSSIDVVLAQWRLRPTAAQAALLEEVFLGMVAGGYEAAG